MEDLAAGGGGDGEAGLGALVEVEGVVHLDVKLSQEDDVGVCSAPLFAGQDHLPPVPSNDTQTACEPGAPPALQPTEKPSRARQFLHGVRARLLSSSLSRLSNTSRKSPRALGSAGSFVLS